MPTVTPKEAPDPRSILGYDGSNFFVIKTDSDGHLQVDVLEIDVLAAALQSVATDRFQVRGEDQLHSYEDTLQIYVTGELPIDDGWLATDPVPAADVWVITNIQLENATTSVNSARVVRWIGATPYYFGCLTRDIPFGEIVCWCGWQWAKDGHVITGQFVGGKTGDVCRMWITGHIMTKET